MKILTNRKKLLYAIKTAMKTVVEQKNNPELSGLLLEADVDSGIITITGTDIHTQIQYRLCNEQILESGSIIIKPIVSEMLRLLEGENVYFETTPGKQLEISSGRAKYSIPILKADKFPKTQIPFPEDFICIKGINSLIKKTIFATDPHNHEAHKKSLQFVKLSFSNGHIKAEATDGHIAALTQSPHGSDGSLEIILHEKALSVLASIVSANEELYVGIAGNFAVFIKDDIFFSSQLYKGDYIEGSKLIEYVKPIYKATIDSKELCGIAEHITAIMGNSDDQCVNICIGKENISMNAQTITGLSKAQIPANNTIPTNNEGFYYNPKWVLNCIKHTSGPITLSLDNRGFMLIEANHNCYCISPRQPARLKESVKKTGRKNKTKSKGKDTTQLAA